MSTDSRTKFTRRKLLGGLGGLTVALTAPIWKPATSFGAAAKPAKRFIGVFSANGTIPEAFFPNATGADNPLTLGPECRILAPLAAYKSKMLVMKGVDMISTNGPNHPGGPHMKGPGGMLTGGTLLPGPFTGSEGPAGYANSISIDQLIANRQQATTRFPSLEFGVRIQGQEPLRYISYRGASMPNTAVDDPWQIYSRIFSSAGMTDAQLAKLIADRKSVLDFLKDDITRLESRFAAGDKARLDAHLTGIQRIEQQLTAGTQMCKAPTMPARIDPEAMENFPTIAKLQMDLMLLALTCGMTNVATFMFANADSWQYYPWIGVNEEHHTLSHGGDSDTANTEKLVTINIWHAQQIAYMLDGLAKATDADGSTVLDNSLLLWGNELGKGNTHTYQDIPWVLAGGVGGQFRMGRYLQYNRQPHNNMLVSIANAFGFTDVKTFGDATVCTGMFTNLF
ncbi:MAG TPA: DUF1552 domain-containing protein [Polyangia bacterium]|jgi:hypothetical protein|nr:DUF1552 domain-containing protein [Polyangia bacterium]